MRLEQHMNVREAASAGRAEGGANFGRVMAVIVDHRDASLYAADLKTPLHAAKGGQSFANRFDRNVQLQADRDRGRGVQHVMRAGDSDESARDRGPEIADENRSPYGRRRNA